MSETAGYMVAFPPQTDGSPWTAEWDCEIHSTLDAAQKELANCRSAGYDQAELVRVVRMTEAPA